MNRQGLFFTMLFWDICKADDKFIVCNIILDLDAAKYPAKSYEEVAEVHDILITFL